MTRLVHTWKRLVHIGRTFLALDLGRKVGRWVWTIALDVCTNAFAQGMRRLLVHRRQEDSKCRKEKIYDHAGRRRSNLQRRSVLHTIARRGDSKYRNEKRFAKAALSQEEISLAYRYRKGR